MKGDGDLMRENKLSSCESSSDLGRPNRLGSSRTRSEKQEHTLHQIELAAQNEANILDLSQNYLKVVPDDLLKVSFLEYLYLEGNELKLLPDNFFDCLPNLCWLDLRRNYITHLPCVYLTHHCSLRTLLLEGNELKSLPLELGLVSSLQGLNISNNPLEFPPLEIIEMGTKHVLSYLRELLTAKLQGNPLAMHVAYGTGMKGMTHLTDNIDSNQSHSGESSDDGNGSTLSYGTQLHHRQSHLAPMSSPAPPHLVGAGPVLQSASLHQLTSYDEIKRVQMEKIRKVLEKQDLNPVKKKKTTKHFSLKAAINSDKKPHLDRAQIERAYAKQKELNEKTQLILQRRKDQQTLKQWRDESTKLQRKKYMESLTSGSIDFIEPASQAPYDIDHDHMKVPTNEERIKTEIRSTHEKMRRAMSPSSRKKVDDQKEARDRELQRRIKMHAAEMQDRRRKPKQNPQQEMEAAKKELAIVKSLQSDLLKRYQDLKSWSPSL